MKFPFLNKIKKSRHIYDSKKTNFSINFPLIKDKYLFLIVCILVLLGLFMVYESSAASALKDFNNQYHYVFDQIKWVGIGLIALIFFSILPYKLYQQYAIHTLILCLLGLVLVLIPGIGLKVMGARRWLDFGLFVVQPSEIFKLGMCIYLSSWLSNKKPSNFIPFLLLLGLSTILLVFEPDLGSTIIIAGVMIFLYFMSGAPLWQFSVLIPLCIFAIFFIAVISPYRFQRLLTFVNIEHDPLGASYQVRQVLMALGSGGLFGRGIGESRQKYAYLPEASTDSIFAIIGEEFGFLGGMLLITLYSGMVWRGFYIAKHASTSFGMLLAAGITTSLGIQAGINLAAMVALLPLTGITLPFISYGGSSLVVSLVSIGILINISSHKK